VVKLGDLGGHAIGALLLLNAPGSMWVGWSITSCNEANCCLQQVKICTRRAADALTDNMHHNARAEVNIAWKIVLSLGVPISEMTVVDGKKKKLIVFSYSNSSRCVYYNWNTKWYIFEHKTNALQKCVTWFDSPESSSDNFNTRKTMVFWWTATSIVLLWNILEFCSTV